MRQDTATTGAAFTREIGLKVKSKTVLGAAQCRPPETLMDSCAKRLLKFLHLIATV